MANKGTFLDDALYDYMQAVSVRPDAILEQLRLQTESLPNAIMQIAPEQGQFMQLLVKLMGAKRTIEVGVFTGYSALAVAQALPADGEIIACDIEKKWTDMALPYWEKAGVAHKIKLKLAPADQSLKALLELGESNKFDFAFIDANKTAYNDYYELCLELIKPGGLIMLDNTFMHKAVLNNDKKDKTAEAIRQINLKVFDDDRVDMSMIPMGDGITLARKK